MERLPNAGSIESAMVLPAMLSLCGLCAPHGGEIGREQEVLFFPSLGHRTPDGQWSVHVHAWIYEADRQWLVGVVQTAFAGKLRKEDLDTELFRRRTQPFFYDSQSREVLRVRIAGRECVLAPTPSSGHAIGDFTIPATASPASAPTPPATLDLRAILPSGDNRVFQGVAFLVPETGISVISDIDDTIRVTHVRNRKRAFRSTFCEPFVAVAGMPELYRHWADAHGAVFHYVSTSPWQLYPPLSDFLRSERFPPGSVHLREFRWRKLDVIEPFPPADPHKFPTVTELLTTFPRRRFVLVGDSGERDPEIYASIERQFRPQIAAILIRDVTGEPPEAPRYQAAFEGVPRRTWRVFQNPAELRDALRDIRP